MNGRNVIYIHTHDSGRQTGPYGSNNATPNLNKFAKKATVFRQAYCVAPTCSPSRASMLTGCAPHNNGMLGLAHRGFVIDSSKHIVKYLDKFNYQTVLCGVQHEHGQYLQHQTAAQFLGYESDITAYDPHGSAEDMMQWDMDNARAVAQFLDKRKDDRPLFLSFGMNCTHRAYPTTPDSDIDVNFVTPPYPVPDTAQTRLDYAQYLTSLKNADNCIGIVMDAIHRNSIAENSVIIFTTDHGVANPFAKCTLFDSGIGVSLVIRAPKSKTNGQVVDNLVSHIDVFPTLCDLLDIPKPQWLEGKSFAKSFEDVNAATDEEVYGYINFHTSYEPARSIRTKRYKYIRYYDKDYLNINFSNIDDSVAKTLFMDNGLKQYKKYSEALYDLMYDQGERNNVINNVQYKKIAQEMSAKLDKHMKDNNDPLLHGKIPFQKQWRINKPQCIIPNSPNLEDYEDADC